MIFEKFFSLLKLSSIQSLREGHSCLAPDYLFEIIFHMHKSIWSLLLPFLNVLLKLSERDSELENRPDLTLSYLELKHRPSRLSSLRLYEPGPGVRVSERMLYKESCIISLL